MNILNIKTGYELCKKRNTRQKAIDVAVTRALKATKIDPKKVFTGNVDFISNEDIVKYTHIVGLAGLGEDVYVEEMNTWKIIYDERESA